jgi:hypothetical protein
VVSTQVGGFDFIPAQAHRSVDSETGLAWDRTGGVHDGRLYLLYTQEHPAESDDLDVRVTHTDNDGLTWSPSVRVNQDNGHFSQFMPKISLDQSTGDVAVSWYDCRNDFGNGGNGDTNGRPNDDVEMYTAQSTDGGVTFGPNQRISQGVSNATDAHNGIDLGDYIGQDFFDGTYFPAWADNSNSTGDNPDGTLSTLDVYTARVHISA